LLTELFRFVHSKGFGKYGIQESSRVDCALAIVERDHYADAKSLRSKDTTVRGVFHLGSMSLFLQAICPPNDIVADFKLRHSDSHEVLNA
jgi:hypothetical protein